MQPHYVYLRYLRKKSQIYLYVNTFYKFVIIVFKY